MRIHTKTLLFFLSALFILSCATTSNNGYGKEAVKLHFQSGADLNIHNDLAHTLLICVYQLKDPNAFKQLADEEKGLIRLLECSSFDAPSVTGFKKLVIQPEEKITKILDRAEGTKYIGIVAGYYRMNKDKMIRLLEVPIGFFTRRAKEMDIKLYFGSQEIQEYREE